MNKTIFTYKVCEVSDIQLKPSEKVLVALRVVYNLPFNLDDPVGYLLISAI